MALRNRDLVSAIEDRENLTSKPSKTTGKPPLLTRRPALDELSNKLNTNKPTFKKPELLKVSKAAVKEDPQPKEERSTKQNEPKSYSSAQIETVAEPDIDNSDDPQLVSEYVTDIYNYLRESEAKFRIREKFLEGHKSTPRMRAILINWLVQVHSNFGLCLETLHLCVSIIDRYLQDRPEVGRESLQLVGTSALFIACKYEEMYVPDLSDFEYVCDNSVSRRQILKMEVAILTALDFNLGKPLPIHFLRRYSKIGHVRLEHHNLSKYLLELAMLDTGMSQIEPSVQAAAACCLSLSIIDNVTYPSKAWTSSLAHYTTYKYSDFKYVVLKFAELLLRADTSKYKSVYLKYADTAFSKTSLNPKLKGPLVKRLGELAQKV